MSEELDLFRAAWLYGTERFNEHDFEAGFAGIPEDLEWHPREIWQPMGGVIRGREELIRNYHELVADFPDWHIEALEFLELGSGVFAVRALATAEGRASGIPVHQEFTQVWETDPVERRPIRVREYEGQPPLSGLIDDPLPICQATMESFNSRDVDAMLARLDPEVEWWPLRSETEGAFYGHDGIRAWIAETSELFEHSCAHIERARWEGDAIVAEGRASLRGKQSGAPIELPVTWLFRLRDDKVIWGRAFSDPAAALAALD